MSKKVHQINKKLQKAKNPGEAYNILKELEKKNPDLYRKVKDQPGR